jgi:hypothetical protein
LYCIGWGRGEAGGFVWQNDFGGCGGGWRRGAGRRVIGRRDGAAGLQGAETGERAFELAVVARFVAVEEFERARFIGQGTEGDEGLGGQVAGLGEFRFVDLLVEAGGLHVPEAHLAPAGDGHVLDQGFFGGGLGLMLLLIGSEEVDEGFAGFVFEDDGFRENAVTETVARGG